MKRIALIGLILLAGCGESESKDSNSNTNENSANGTPNNASVSPAECSNECQTKAAACGAPAELTEAACGEVCNGAVSQEQLNCLRNSTCEELAAADMGFCADGTSNNTSNNSSMQNNAMPNNASTKSDLGGSCNCDAHPEYNAAEPAYGYCEGTENGCIYNIGAADLQLGCLYNYKTGAGTCMYLCGVTEEGTQGSCRDGDICESSGLRSITDGLWYECR